MEITHDTVKQKFYVIVNGLESHLEYVRNDNVLNLNHTYVPNELRGKGIAGKLVEAALTYVRENNLKIMVNNILRYLSFYRVLVLSSFV